MYVSTKGEVSWDVPVDYACPLLKKNNTGTGIQNLYHYNAHVTVGHGIRLILDVFSLITGILMSKEAKKKDFRI